MQYALYKLVEIKLKFELNCWWRVLR